VKRAIAFVLLFVATPAFAAEKWVDAYKRGIGAITNKNYDAGIDAMQRALAEMPNESAAARYRNESIVYVPHYWIGVAKFNLGDIDGALRELHTSEEHGAILNTDYYSKLRDYVARANAAKLRAAQSAAADSRKTADAAVSHAMSTQMDALGAGADRRDSYRTGQRKLQEAMNQLKSGADSRSYRSATEAANQAADLFASAAEEARRAKAARPPAVAAKPTPQPVQKPVVVAPPPAPVPVEVAKVEVQTIKAPPPEQPAPAPAPAVERKELADARVSLQQLRQRLTTGRAKSDQNVSREAKRLDAELRKNPNDATLSAVMSFVQTTQRNLDQAALAKPAAPVSKPDLTIAYRAFAHGDIDKSDALLTSMIDTRPSPEALLLRGCARYTAAMLSRKPDLKSAESDFKTALKLNRGLRLDRDAFSPKLVAYFEGLRKKS
jgi:hypothetical protein